MPRLTGEMLAEVVHRKGATAGSLDCCEFKALPVSWFDGLARIFSKVEELGVWPEGLLDAYIAMIPKVGGDSTPLGQRPSSGPSCCLSYFGPQQEWCSLKGGFDLGPLTLFIVLGVVAVLLRLGTLTALDIEEVLSGVVDSDVHLLVADVIQSFDTVDGGILDHVLSSLGLPGWFRHADFEYHAHVRLRFKLASGLGQSWTRDGSIPQGCSLSMRFIVALYLPWCRYLDAQCGVSPQLYADNLKCVSWDSDLLLRAASFTTGYVRLVGHEPAPSKCVLLRNSRAVRVEMRGWVLSDEGHKWTVKLDVRDLGGHLDTTLREWSSTLSLRVRLVISRLDLIFALPLDFYGRVRVVRAMFLPCALHGVEASYLSKGSFLKLRAAVMCAVWSRKQPLACSGAVLGLLDGPHGCDPSFCIVWFRFRLFRRYLSFRPVEVPRLYRLLDLVHDGCSGHGPIHALVASARRIGFSWNSWT